MAASDQAKINDKFTSDPLVARWLATVTDPGSRRVYISSIRTFFGWLGMGPKEFVQAILDDNRKGVLERENLALTKILEYHQYAMTEMPRRGHYSKKIVGKGISYNATKTHLTGVRSFLAHYGILVKLTGRYCLKPNGRDPHERMMLSIDQVRSLVSHARLPRDRAIVAFIAQTGVDLDTLVSLKYRTVKAALESEPPAQLDIFRGKASMPYFTFMAKDSIEAVKAYLKDLEHRGVELKPDDSLWLTEKSSKPLNEHNVGRALRSCAVRAGLIDKDDPYNIAGGHALREFFSSTLNDAKVPKNYIDEMLGHTPSQMDKAYFKKNMGVMKSEYARVQDAISITPVADAGAVSKLKEQFGDHIEAQILKNGVLEAKNTELERRLSAVTAIQEELQSEIRELKAKIDRIIGENVELRRP